MIKTNYRILRIDDLSDQLQGTSFFSKIDLQSRYHQLRLREGYIMKIGFHDFKNILVSVIVSC